MPKSLKDILAGVKSSKIVPGSTGSDPGVDYAPKAGDEQEFVKKHKREKHEDRVGNGDDIYQATNVKHSQASEPAHGHKSPKDKSVYEAKKVGDVVDVSSSKNNPDYKSKATVKFVGKGYSIAKDKGGKQYTIKHEETKCNMTEEGTACPVHEMADCSKSKKTLKEITARLDEVNHRAYAVQGKMHPDMAKDMDVGMHTDFYHNGTGDKAYGMVTKNDGKTIHIRSKARTGTLGKTHKYSVSANLSEETLDEAKNSEAKVREALKNLSREHEQKHPNDFFNAYHSAEKIGEKAGVSPAIVHKHMKASRGLIGFYHKNLPNGKVGYRHIKEETLDELNTKTLLSYKRKAENNVRKRENDADESAEMAKTQLRALANKAIQLAMQLNDDQVVEPWVQSKIAVAKDHVSAVHDYMVYGNNKEVKKEGGAPYDGGIDMTGAPRNTLPGFSADVNTGRSV